MDYAVVQIWEKIVEGGRKRREEGQKEEGLPIPTKPYYET